MQNFAAKRNDHLKYLREFDLGNSFLKIVKSACVAATTILVTLTAQVSFAAPGLDVAVAVAPYLDGAFPETSPGSAEGDWIQVDYYPGLNFVEPIRIIEHPVDDRLLIVQKDGTGWTVSHQQGATDRTMFFDIRPIMHGKSGIGEGGISDLAFHPEFGLPQSPNSNYVYITYRWSPTQSGSFTQSPTVDGYNRLSRFSVINGQVALNTEQVLINQYDRQQWHIGGDMFFGNDGFLYISTGDEGNCCNRLFNTQRLDGGLFSGILRIDVDQDSNRSHPIRRQPTHLEEDPTSNGPQWPQSFSQNYYIPNDNPFVDPSGNSLEEFYSIGLRHPWTISRDPATGNIWIADVGQSAMEEINISRRGDNHQWGYAEGTVGGVIPRPANIIGNEAPPVWAYPRSEGQAVIGAGVYRGSKFPDLIGKYLFSDFLTGNLWTAAADGNSSSIEQIGTVTAGFPNGVNSYLLDSKGDILMARTAGGLAANGKIEMLTRAADVIPTAEPPAALSQTGAFTDLVNMVPHAGCVPYELNVPFWSDASVKSRWMCIPNDGDHNTNAEKIGFTELGNWSFPQGAVLIKHFELLTNVSNPFSSVKLETRFIVHGEDGYYGVTYRWNDSGTDAFLLTQGEEETYTVNTPSGSFEQTWQFPSRADCLTCHTDVAGGVLGPNTRQLNGNSFYPTTGRIENQLETLNSLGMFSPAIEQSEITEFLNSVLTSAPTLDTSLSLSARARSYLDTNCSYCHLPGGVRANFDARLTTPLASQGFINGELVESLGISNEAVIVPGSLDSSVLFHRLASAGESFSMPPIAKSLVDEASVDVVREWIQALDSFDVGNDTSSGGSFIDGHHPSLYINEQDTFVHDNEPGSLYVKEFKFYAQRLGNPLTPVVVRVNGNNNFTVLAIGTTRTQSEYSVGQNIFPFSDNGVVKLTLVAGDTIAVGFMDSFADGSGWGAGTVIPAEAGSGANQDEIWALLPAPLINQTTGFLANRDTTSVELNQTILATNAGKNLNQFTNLRRSYKFAIAFGLTDNSSTTPTGNAPVFANGSFENPAVNTFSIFSDTNAIPGWTITAGSVELDKTPWPASDGLQSMDLSGDVAGSLEQTLNGFVPGADYELLFDYGLHGTATTSRSADVLIGGNVADTITASTEMLVPNYQTAKVPFVAPQSGEQTFGFSSLSPNSRGVVIDDVRVSLIGLPDAGPLPNPGSSHCSSGQDNLLVNGSFEETSNPAYSSAAQLIASIGLTHQGVKFIDKHPDSDFPGWFTTGGIALQQGGFSQGGTIELGLNGFLGFNTPDGEVFAELDGNHHNQIISVTPGQLLDWEFTHRGRVGVDTISIAFGAVGSPTVIATVSSPNTQWVTHTGQYQVPGNVSEIQLSLTPVSASNGDIDSSHLLDDVKLCAANLPEPEPEPEPEPGTYQCNALSNVAPGGSASQSSNWVGNSFPASNAIDGVLGNFTHTAQGQTPASWQLTLSEDSVINQVVLHNRDGCCSSRLRDLTVSVLDSTNNTIYQSQLLNPENNLNSPALITLDLPESLLGRVIQIVRTPDPDLSGGSGNADEASVLALGEVQVNGCALSDAEVPQLAQNVALNKAASQSTTSHNGQASRAVDGDTNGTYSAGSVTHTNANSNNGTLNPWWRVDLGASYDVLEINIFNRTDNCCTNRLNGATVYIGNVNSTNPADYTAIGTLTGSSSVQTVTGANISGRYVMVRLEGTGILSLAEVQVIGF